ncbi:MAG TPA: hypothetical protein VM680_01385 [Verrucomicrobiae bacterium]|nr:hypothetical protein [Verrucomicrobiae bacterium]
MKLKFLTLTLLALAFGAALSTFLSWRAHIREDELRSQLAQRAKAQAAATAERDQLRDALNARQTALEHRGELLRLRAEVGELRHRISDVSALNAALENLKQEVAVKDPDSEDPGPDPSKVRAFWSRDQLAFAGHAEETAGLQSCLWALTRGDTNAIVAAIAPDCLKELWRLSKPTPTDEDIKGTSAEAIAARQGAFARLAESLAPATGFYLISDNLLPKIPDMLAGRDPQAFRLYKVYFAGERTTRGVALKKVDGAWKLMGIYSLGGTDEQPTYEADLWL